jgi:hypothetical protein
MRDVAGIKLEHSLREWFPGGGRYGQRTTLPPSPHHLHRPQTHLPEFPRNWPQALYREIKSQYDGFCVQWNLLLLSVSLPCGPPFRVWAFQIHIKNLSICVDPLEQQSSKSSQYYQSLRRLEHGLDGQRSEVPIAAGSVTLFVVVFSCRFAG